MRFFAAAFALPLLALLAACASTRAEEPRFTVVTVDPSRDRLQLFLNDEHGRPYTRLDRLAAARAAPPQPQVVTQNERMNHTPR